MTAIDDTTTLAVEEEASRTVVEAAAIADSVELVVAVATAAAAVVTAATAAPGAIFPEREMELVPTKEKDEGRRGSELGHALTSEDIDCEARNPCLCNGGENAGKARTHCRWCWKRERRRVEGSERCIVKYRLLQRR